MASVPGVPIVRNDFFVLYGDYNRYVLQFQVGSVRFEENGHIVATLLLKGNSALRKVVDFIVLFESWDENRSFCL